MRATTLTTRRTKKGTPRPPWIKSADSANYRFGALTPVLLPVDGSRQGLPLSYVVGGRQMQLTQT